MTIRRTLAMATMVAVGVLATIAGATSAGAQVDIDATEVPAASRTTLQFTVVTGCGSSPTTELAVTLPEGTFEVVPVPPPGFTTQMLEGGSVVVFQGGPVDADTPATFGIEMVTPNRPGTTVQYPVEQTCVDGAISWSDPNPEGEGAAPRLLLTENPSPIVPSDTLGATTTEPASGTTTLLPNTDPAASEPVPEVDASGGSRIGVILLAAAAVVAGYVLIRRQRAARH